MAEALRQIRQLRDGGVSSGVSALDALKYVIFLADVNQLYLVALGLYDFDLVLMVAQQSQKDPKEYLPFLANLQKMPLYQQRYHIDMHLQRFDHALRNLSQAGDECFNDCLRLIEEKELFLLGLELFPFQADRQKWKAVMRLYAQHLMRNKHYSQAGLAFRACEELASALEAFQAAGDWMNQFMVAGELGLSGDDLGRLAHDTAVRLADTMSRYADAARILIDYCRNVEDGTIMLTRAQLWLEALRTSHLFGRADLIESHIQPALLSEWSSRREELVQHTERFNYCIQRLITIRHNKANLPPAEDEDEDDRPYDDSASVASGASNLSSFTLTSQISDYASNASEIRRAIKQAKKQKRIASKLSKKKIKEGHPQEEAFLAREVQKLTPTASTHHQYEEVVRALLMVNEVEKAAVLQREYAEFVALVARLKSSLPPSSPNHLQPTATETSQDTSTSDQPNSIDFLQVLSLSLPNDREAKSKYDEDQADDSYSLF
eukprot:TRINITY_DN10163_c0_g1_i5.p1 TRINITY_DN10163_c0_g1~~TRINITY_DN10163_c0_g1_i5.p1  ORF type:complete len:550 (-),score=210.34 TRINITY_DN10163_c0_g1_i5:34-1509(-)